MMTEKELNMLADMIVQKLKESSGEPVGYVEKDREPIQINVYEEETENENN